MSRVLGKLQGRHVLLAFGGGSVRARRGGAASGVSGEGEALPTVFVCLFVEWVLCETSRRAV